MNGRARRVALVPQVQRPRFGRADVWVESPLQLLSAIEAHGAGLLGRHSTIHPRGGTAGMDTTVRALMAQAPPGVGFSGPGPQEPPAPDRPADRWVTGDAFSGRIQRRLMGPVHAEEFVIIDDGLATVKLLQLLTGDRPVPLVRSRGPRSSSRNALGVASWYRLRALARQGRLLACTALPISHGVEQAFRQLGGHLEHHRFEWLGTQPVTERFLEPTIVVGSALAADGLIGRAPYLSWVLDQTGDGPVGYFPHRREDPGFLAELARHPLITVHPNTIPVEMRLRGLRRGQRVTALPSTVLPSLRLLLRPRQVAITGQPIPGHWWTDAASPALRAHLGTSVEEPGS
ncbi:MAG: hypothetical protein ACTHWW_11355 [Arthrobacter sp.]|uniref:hypothetical protein n=1 Tax=unclassified Arthrobacter TaxID=235627 RepID=UPI00265418D3|nr:hypothetical protein [Micrococcaceae bacterium]MDN5825361.1 hypothetical protein [Micrococcaceae bacterium]MDN5880128.1 hypothetical protein [Micrococcaceae bacterium]MDN5887915.1 hypothetical protein [Micrococcaceae bacterium]